LAKGNLYIFRSWVLAVPLLFALDAMVTWTNPQLQKFSWCSFTLS